MPCIMTSLCDDAIICDAIHRGARYHTVAVCLMLGGLLPPPMQLVSTLPVAGCLMY